MISFYVSRPLHGRLKDKGGGFSAPGEAGTKDRMYVVRNIDKGARDTPDGEGEP